MDMTKTRICFLALLLVVVAGCCHAVAADRGGDGASCRHDSTDVVVLGDSNTWIGGDSCNLDRGWTRWFCEAFRPASCRSYARSGATWTATERTVRDVDEYTERLGDNNVIYNQVCRLLDAVRDGRQPVPSLIIIAAGTNDAWFPEARPRALDVVGGDSDSADGRNDVPGSMLTLADAVRHCCGMLAGTFPKARIVLLTPMQSTAVSTRRIVRAGDVIEECGRRMGLTVIRQDRESCVRRKRELRRRRMTTDGTHTSAEGARLNGIMIAESLRR